MAVHLNQQDLTFILRQIRIAEAHASGIDLTELRVDPATGDILTDRSLYNPDGLWLGAADAPRAIPDPHVPYGLRTVDGTFNNIVPGRETWGSSGQPMPQLLDKSFVNDQDGDAFDPDGPGPAPAVTNTDYGTGGSVADADPRIISNLVVDASLNNPAAIAAALRLAGSTDILGDQRLITAAYEALRTAQGADPAGEHAELQSALDTILQRTGVTVTNGSIDVLNVAPDEGLSKPFNAWMTFFGQFFDHGLDLITKGGNGTVYIPLTADDPLVTQGPDGMPGTSDEVTAQTQFMVLTRSTPVEGSQRNVTTPFVDQNQTYTSNASHQVFLREYALVDGKPVATGLLLGGVNGGLATWADVKEQARTMLGINLVDADVSAVPQLLTDPYGAFIPGADGMPQVMVGITPGGQPVYASGTLAAPLSLSAIQLPVGTVLAGPNGTQNTIEAGETVAAARTFNAFLDDIANDAVPTTSRGIALPQDGDTALGFANADGSTTGLTAQGRNLAYDNELLDRHFITGDGRGNENIGLTAVHHIFHSEHNRQVEAHKLTILRSGDLAFINAWLETDIAGLPAGFAQLSALEQTTIANGLDWDGERLFQAGRFATEMQYQHLVFEEFARKVQPQIDPFVFNAVTEINPAIFAEFANTVYRFGHSMLTENLPRVGVDGAALDDGLGLIEAFLNPVLFDSPGDLAPTGTPRLSHDEAAAAIIRGMTVERGSEIDEFVVDALRNNLLGLPLDLAALNIARGRETGTPTLNEARAQLFAATGSTFLTPYTSWADMAGNLKNAMSVVNFVAAYGTHPSVVAATTLDGKRDAALALVLGGVGAPEDRLDYLNSRGAWAGRETGYNAVDLWIGGLAEKQMPFGGLLGSTFNAVFEAQMENLQDADRFYYLTRTQGQNFLVELEQNSFSKLMMANTNLAEPGPDGIRGTGDDIVPRHIGVDAFADYDFELEVNAANQSDQNGSAPGVDPTGADAILEAMGLGKVMRDDPGSAAVEANYLRFTGGEHVLVGGTNGNDTIVTDFGDDGIWGDAGNDRIESGAGVDLVNGGDGDDIITDSGDSGDFLKGEGGNDVIANSNGIDILIGGTGKDVVFVGVDSTEVFSGDGDDFVIGGDGADLLMGNEGDDWLEAGGGFDTTAGDNSELFFNSAIKGHDVMFAGGDEHDFDGESGDDIMVQGESVMRNEGMFGFDWAIFKGNARDAHADMRIPIFTTEEADILRNRFDKVEALSGWKNNDTLIGDDRTAADGLAEEPGAATVGANEGVFFNDGLDADGLARIDGLNRIVSLGSNGLFEAGNILLGGAGSDVLQGNGGNDILDGDRWLNVRIRITRPDDSSTPAIESASNTQANQLTSVDSLRHTFTQGQVTTDGLPASWVGKSLFELLLSRDVRPDQMHIVREIVSPDANASDVDTAVFSDVRANYSITRGTGAEAGTLTVRHVTLSDPAVDDGTDTLRNIEALQFADGPVAVALILNQPFDRLNIVASDGDIGRFDAVFTGLVAGRPVTVQWQVLDANGTWRNVGPGDGLVGNALGGPSGDRFTPANPNVEVRAVANWTSTLPGVTQSQQTLSVETAFVGTAGDDDLPGSTAANVILGLAGDDDIEGDVGNDIIDGGDGNDRVDGGAGDDDLRGNDGDDVLIGRTGDNTLRGGAGDDQLSGGHGNDAIDGDAGTDTAIVTGPVEAYAFERTGAVITVTDNLGLEGDGRDTLTEVEFLQVGDTDVYAIGAAGTAGADIVVGTVASETLAGGAGDDLVFAGGGNDSVTWRPGDGRDFVDGGAGTDTFRILDGALPVQQLGLAAARAQFPTLTFRDDTQSVVVRGGVVIAELKNVEAVRVNTAATGVPAIVDPTPTNGLVSPTEGQALSVSTVGIADANGLGAFAFQWQVLAADGVTWNAIAGATGQGFTPAQAQVGAVLRVRVSFTDGEGNPEEVFSAPTGIVGDNFTGAPLIGLNFVGTAGDDIANGANALLFSNDTMDGRGGNDIINGRAGNDRITQLSVDGRDRVDGGAGTDTYVLNGVAAAEAFGIYALTGGQNATLAATLGTTFGAATEIVITRTVGTTTTVVAELDNVEEIQVNTLNVTANDGGGLNQGAAGNDTVTVSGNFTGTSLNFSTITIDGAAGDDTVDISGLTSAHRIVFRSNGGHDTIIGTLRPQDVIELAPGTTRADYTATQANGMTTLTNGSHTITYASSGTPAFGTTPVQGGEQPGGGGAFTLTAADLAGIKNLIQGRPAVEGDDDTEGATGVRTLSGAGNNLDHPEFGAADQPFIRLTDAHYGAFDPATNNNALNPLYAGLDPRAISNVLGTQEADLPHQANGSNIFFMAFGQYFDHGLDFLPKSAANGTVLIDQPGSGRAPGTNNPADLTRGEVSSIVDGVPQHLNKTSPYVDQNQAYGSHELVGQFLRESDGNQGVGARLLAGAPDPSNPAFNLLPTLRALIQHHWDADTIFHDPSLPGGAISFRTYFSNFPISETKTGSLFNAAGAYDPEAVSAFASNFMGSGNALLLDTNPFVSLLDHYVAGDGRANENVSLTAMHTIWARNHNFHVENLVEAGFQGTPEEVFQAAKMINEAEYQRVIFDEFADQLIGGMKGSGTHGHNGYNPDVDARISHEFASAVYRVGHSLIGETLTVIGPDGAPRQVALFDAFLNPSNAPDVFTASLPPGYVPQPGYAQLGANAILAGVATQPAEEVDFNIVDAVRNDLVRINADLFAFNVARGRDVGLGSLNQVRADLMASTDPYIREALGFAGDLTPYASWEDFQARNGLSDTVIAQFKAAYPDLALATADMRAAFVAANPDIAIHQRPDGTEYVNGIDRVDLWVGGLAEQHINGGVVGQTFWVVLHEQFDRLQEGDRFYYTDRFDNFDFYQNIIDGQNFSDIVARNTGLTGLQEDIFAVSDEDGTAGGDGPADGEGDGTGPIDDGDDGTAGGDGSDDGDDDTTGSGGSDDGDDSEDGDDSDDGTTAPGTGGGSSGGGATGGTTGGGTTTPPAELPASLVAGTTGDDVLSGTPGADTLLGLSGDDNILAGDGADVIRGGDGNDFVDAGGGRDVVFGGAGDDDILAGSGDDMVYGDAGADRILAGAGNDLVTAGAGNDTVIGGDGNDLFVAEVGDGGDSYWGDEVGGGTGADTLDMSAITANIAADLGTGLAGRGSVASSQSGSDTLWGIENLVTGSGDDTITASDAVNVMDGGRGADTYRFGSAAAANGDTIASFQPGDKVDLSGIDANQGVAGNQAFTLATGAAFTGVGELLVTQEHRADGDYTVVAGNTGGDAAPEFKFSIKGAPAATAADFAL
ncbi:heme peroxidase [Methylobacterium sp. Leaf111]|uniref:peroxidase family protein n=1 Tax=Methylobacterium sp. Leaf111 TaxID=1736257 RepID=UPI0006FB99A9|nr:peroxidase family protein [Methylobacterium sp. Leaf111]KQP73785.1 heme peroxidase [Methylobacterium sp. Leaf111]